MFAFFSPQIFFRVWLFMVKVLLVSAGIMGITVIHRGMGRADFGYLIVTALPALFILYLWTRRPYRFLRRRIQAARHG